RLRRDPGADRVDHQLHVGARLPRALAQDDLVADGALAPVDVARIVALAHRAERVRLVPRAAPVGRRAARAAPGLLDREAHRIDGRVDDELALGVDLARLLEQPEGEARGDAEAGVAVAAAARGRAAVGGDLRRRGADLEEEAALVGRLAR